VINNNNRSQIINDKINIQNLLLNKNNRPINKRIRKIRHFTHVGFNGEHEKHFNQDSAFLEHNFAGNNSYLYLAVCDGHGVEGHEVSGFIKKILPKELSNALYRKNIMTNGKNIKKQIYNIISETFIKVNEKLISNEAINSVFSGTTCVSVIFTPQKLICANIGDSRAVLGKYDNKKKKWVPINLSRDHKPTEEDERRRIFNKGGRIKAFIDEITGEEYGPQRVWLKDDEVPGLAMTRSFGDRVAAIAGTICVPEIKEYAFHEGDKFVILASDGVWEFISSEECINIIGKFYENNDIVQCCEYLYEESRKRWIKEEEVVDDITMLIMFFD
jgi:serine/threonine protein phosphatase PrpC